MSPSRSPLWCALVLTLIPSIAAAESSLVDWAKQRVDQGLLQPLSVKEHKRSRFSRERPPPVQRRVRITQASYSVDKNERKFVPFVVDMRFGEDEWQSDIQGCVYQGSGDLFVKVGDSYRPAAFLLGKNVDPVPDVCEAVPTS